MPELPEVETVRDGLDRFVVGAVVRRAEVLRDYSVRRHEGGPADFAARVAGRRLDAAVRRGKFLWLPLSDDDGGPGAPAAPAAHPAGLPGEALLAHLGMSGQLLVHGGTSADDWRHPHLRVRLHLEGAPRIDGTAARYLDFVDQRTFGHLSVQELVPDDAALPAGSAPAAGSLHAAGAASSARSALPDAPEPPDRPPPPAGWGSDLPVLPAPVAHIARDLLDPYADRAGVARRVRRRRTQIKRALLDQTLVSGVGNIYADEALWRAKVHGRRVADAMRQADVLRVLDAAAEVMREALGHGGTSFDALYVNVNGESGYFDRSLDVYGREDEPCRRCGTAVRREQFMNRSSYFCPRCQRAPRS